MAAKSDLQFQSSTAKEFFTDEALWNSFKTGNELALSMLYKKYVQGLYDYGMHTSHDKDVVTDCLQELFFRIWKNREHLASVVAAKPYLFKSFRRLLIQELVERRKKSVTTQEQVGFDITPSIEATIIATESRNELLARLNTCVQSLTRNQREIIYLKFFNNLSYQEIADITELQVDSVYNLVSRTIELLRKKLQVTKPLIPLPKD